MWRISKKTIPLRAPAGFEWKRPNYPKNPGFDPGNRHYDSASFVAMAGLRGAKTSHNSVNWVLWKKVQKNKQKIQNQKKKKKTKQQGDCMNKIKKSDQAQKEADEPKMVPQDASVVVTTQGHLEFHEEK